jgi:hypothetical protein
MRLAELPVNAPQQEQPKQSEPAVKFVPDYSSQERQRILRARIR